MIFVSLLFPNSLSFAWPYVAEEITFDTWY